MVPGGLLQYSVYFPYVWLFPRIPVTTAVSLIPHFPFGSVFHFAGTHSVVQSREMYE